MPLAEFAMTDMPNPEMQSRELGHFLRSRRQKLTPEVVGLAGGQRRRTKGLRREEVAELAGISTDWYIRLEQGRNVRPSEATIDALAKALRLSKAEQAHIRTLTRSAASGIFVRETVPDSLKRIVESLNQPAYITGRRWDVLVWNDAAAEIFNFDRVAEEDRNILLLMLTSRESRKLFGSGWAGEAKRMVALFRLTYDLWSGDPAFCDLLDKIREGCPEFSTWWKAHDIHELAAGQKHLQHPKRGTLQFEYATFQANDDPALKLTVYSAAN